MQNRRKSLTYQEVKNRLQASQRSNSYHPPFQVNNNLWRQVGNKALSKTNCTELFQSEEKKTTWLDVCFLLAAYSAMPIGGGVLKQPFVRMQHFGAGNVERSFMACAGDIIRVEGLKGLYRGFFGHAAKVLPSNAAANGAIDFGRGERDKDSVFTNFLIDPLIGATFETAAGLVQENIEFRQTAALKVSVTWSEIFSKKFLRSAMKTAPSIAIRNFGYWESIKGGVVASQKMEELYPNVVGIGHMTKIGCSFAAAIPTTPFHVSAVQAYKTNRANPFKILSVVVKNNGISGLFAGISARTGMVFVSVLLNMFVREWLEGKNETKKDDDNGVVLARPK